MSKLTRLSMLLTILLFIIPACSGGGNGSGGNATTPDNSEPPVQAIYTKVVVRLSLTGTLPVKTAISGAGFILRLPDNVTAAASNGSLDTGVVFPTGTFQGSILIPPIYNKAKNGEPGTINIIMAHTNPAGTTKVGDFAYIVLQFSGGAVPQINDFGLNGTTVVDLLGNVISDVGIIVNSVVLT